MNKNEYEDLEYFLKYIQKVNLYLMQSELLMDTDGGELKYGTPDENRIGTNKFIPDWLFDPQPDTEKTKPEAWRNIDDGEN